MERHLDIELDKLKKKLLDMAALSETMIEIVTRELTNFKIDYSEQVFDYENKVNSMENEIDDTCIDLMAKYKPAATDLRLLISILKINHSLERIGDQAVNIHEMYKKLELNIPDFIINDLKKISSLAIDMVKNIITAFINKDTATAIMICKSDDNVDDLNKEIFEKLMNYIATINDPSLVKSSLELLIISRNYERIADEATNIGEDIVFYVKGDNIKHHNME